MKLENGVVFCQVLFFPQFSIMDSKSGAKGVHCVDLGESFPTSNFTSKSWLRFSRERALRKTIPDTPIPNPSSSSSQTSPGGKLMQRCKLMSYVFFNLGLRSRKEREKKETLRERGRCQKKKTTTRLEGKLSKNKPFEFPDISIPFTLEETTGIPRCEHAKKQRSSRLRNVVTWGLPKKLKN